MASLGIKKVMVTGASGLLGRAIYKEFTSDSSWQALGLAFSRAGNSLRKVDLTNAEEVQSVIADFKPTIIIHSAAERRPDVVENKPEATHSINVDATKTICEAAGKCGAWVLYISTDYVFDGKTPPYQEDAAPNPLNKYGQSKLDGEKVTMSVSEGNGVLRVPILYGEVESLDESAVTVLFEKVKDTSKACVMNDYEIRYPTYCGDIASVIRQLCDKRVLEPENIHGYFHWSGNEKMTKYDMAVSMAECMHLPTDHIKADKSPSTGAPRPYDAHLSCDRIKNMEINSQTTLKDNMEKILRPFT